MKIFLIVIIFSLFYFSLYSQSSSNEIRSESFITLNGSAIKSIGLFKEDWNEGSAIYLNYSSVSSNHWALVFQVGFIKFKQNPENNFDGDQKFNVIPIQVGGKYYFLLDTFRPYLLAMSGINIISQDYSDDGATIDTTSAQLNFQIGLGIDIMLISELGLDLHADYNSHLLNPSETYNITGLEFGAGIKWRFLNN